KYCTLAARLLKSKDPISIQDANTLLSEGPRLLLERGQTGSGTDLGSLAKKVPLGTVERNKLLNLITLTGSSGPWRKTIISAAISWSCDAGDCLTGDPIPNLSIGERLYKENQFLSAVLHVLSRRGKSIINLLWMWSKEDKFSKDETLSGCYAAIGVLGYLELGSIISARSFLEDYISKNVTIARSNGNSPPANNNSIKLWLVAILDSMVGFPLRLSKKVWLLLQSVCSFLKQQRQGDNILSNLMGSLSSGGGSGPGRSSSLPPSSCTNRSIKPSGGMSAPTLD
ncbi:hypothetical protein PSHT_01689, partial [Puccinia striiformis]